MESVPSTCSSRRLKIGLVEVDADQARIARGAFRDYGKGRHPAGLNFGDCFAYALAKTLDEPLLFKGQDFSLTDIVACIEEQAKPDSAHAESRSDRRPA